MRETIFAVFLASALIAGGAQAKNLKNGVNRVGDGTVDAVTAPAEIVREIGGDAQEYGPLAGVVTGTAKGTAKAAGEVAKGGAKLAVGAVETSAASLKQSSSQLLASNLSDA